VALDIDLSGDGGVGNSVAGAAMADNGTYALYKATSGYAIYTSGMASGSGLTNNVTSLFKGSKDYKFKTAPDGIIVEDDGLQFKIHKAR